MTNGATATAAITACQQSHQFQDRKVPLGEDYAKVGRSVARLKPTEDNTIFDCKVLSRNHAVLWYEDGSFYLKDTKSSNGTFVNNERLSKGAEESPPKEIFSGDILQFGVDIIENAKKVTHGCIIAMIRLYHPNGAEAMNTSRPASEDGTSMADRSSLGSAAGEAPGTTAGHHISSSELFQLHQYIKEAAHREAMLETKLETLQGLVASTAEASESNWKALIDEDRLLSRIEMLEAQLLLYSKGTTDDALREEVQGLQKEKAAYEATAKEALRRALEEKVEAVSKMSDVERALETTEAEVARLKAACESAGHELGAVRDLHSNALNRQTELEAEIREWTGKLSAAEERERVSESRREEASSLQSPTLLSNGQDDSQLSQLQEELETARAEMTRSSERAVVVEARLASSDRRLDDVVEAAVAGLRDQLNAAALEKEKTAALLASLDGFARGLEKQLHEILSAPPGDEIVTPPLMNGHALLGKSSDSNKAKDDVIRRTKDDLLAANVCLEKLTNELNTVQKQRLEAADDATQQKMDKDRYQSACAIAESQVEQLQQALATRTEEVEFERRMRGDAEAAASTSDATTSPPRDEGREAFHRQAAKNQAEFASMRDECGRMRERIMGVDAEMKASKKEAARLAHENRALKDAAAVAAARPAAAAVPLDALVQEEMGRLEVEVRKARCDATEVRRRALAMEKEAAVLRAELRSAGRDVGDAEVARAAGGLGLGSVLQILLLLVAIFITYFPVFSLFSSGSSDSADSAVDEHPLPTSE